MLMEKISIIWAAPKAELVDLVYAQAPARLPYDDVTLGQYIQFQEQPFSYNSLSQCDTVDAVAPCDHGMASYPPLTFRTTFAQAI